MQYQLEPELNSAEAKQLYRAIATARNETEVAALLRDVLTLEELNEAVRRFTVAQMLNQGQTFRSITGQVKTSTATVSRVNYWLHHGTNGYRLALKRLSKADTNAT